MVTHQSTLIYGDRDAVLVDALLTMDEGRALADWVAASGRNLTTIYITHGDDDHFFGAPAVLERFPDARMVATESVVAPMREQVSGKWLDDEMRPPVPLSGSRPGRQVHWHVRRGVHRGWH